MAISNEQFIAVKYRYVTNNNCDNSLLPLFGFLFKSSSSLIYLKGKVSTASSYVTISILLKLPNTMYKIIITLLLTLPIVNVSGSIACSNKIVDFNVIDSSVSPPIFTDLASTVDLSEFSTCALNIEATVKSSPFNCNEQTTKCVKFFLDKVEIKQERFAPYTLYGNENADDFYSRKPPLGTHSLMACTYSNKECTKNKSGCKTMNVTFLDCNRPTAAPTDLCNSVNEVTGFTLVNTANPYQPVKTPFIAPVIDLMTFPTCALNIYATVSSNKCKHAPIKCVQLTLGGQKINENFPPYALYGNNGRFIRSGKPELGEQTLKACTYTDTACAKGRSGCLEVDVQVKNCGATNVTTNAPTGTPIISPVTITPKPSVAPIPVPTVNPTLPPYITPPNSTCVIDQGNVTCFCDSGFFGDPSTGCVGLPEVRLTGVSPTSFNAANSTICFVIVNDEFKMDNTSLQVSWRNAVIPRLQLFIAADKVCLVNPVFSQSSANSVSIKAVAAKSGTAISRNESFWVGSGSATVFVLNSNGTQALQEVTVTARLADDGSVTAQQIGGSSKFVFTNLPLRTIIFDAVADDGSAGASALIGSGTTTVELVSFSQPSEIDNNDFSLNTTEGWMLNDELTGSIVAHLENAGPNVTGSGRRLEDVSNKDFVLRTRGFGSQTVSRTFKTKKGTTGVRIRYRFETSEYPRYYLTQYNDFFKVSIRSKEVGGYTSEVNSMNGLGSAAFGHGSLYPSTKWRESVLPVASDGDIIQVDVTVANVGDGVYDSYVYIDFVKELTQGLCIYSNSSPDANLIAGHAALVLYHPDGDGFALTTYGLWPDSHPAVINNGAASDIRTNLPNDMVSNYKYFYCSAITDEQKKKLDGIVNSNVPWTCTNSCASFASETFDAVTGIDVDADDFLGLETPREISQSILTLNGGKNNLLPKEGLPWMKTNRQLQGGSLQTSYPSNFVATCILN